MGSCNSPSNVKGPVDFTGYWALAKHEGMDEFLKAAGFPWVVRKAALKFGGSAVDVIAHVGATMRVTSLNAKGSWARTYDVDREVAQRNAEGTMCRTTSWWEGRVFRTRMEGSQLGLLESWRYMHGNTMAVRTALRMPPRPSSGGGPTNGGAGVGGHEAVMFWFFDRMETLQRHVALGRASGSLLQQIEADQRHVERATRKDTKYIQDVLLDWQRWQSPADEFIQLASPPPLSRHTNRRIRSPASLSPASLSKSPSNDSLTALPAGVEARSIRSESRSRLAESELSAVALDRMARQVAALALAPPDGPDHASPRQAAAAAALGAQQQQQQQQLCAPAAPEQHAALPGPAGGAAAGGGAGEEGQADGAHDRAYGREATLSYPRSENGEIPVEPRPPGGAAAAPKYAQAGSLTFRPGAPDREGGGVHGAATPPPSTRDLLHTTLASGPGSDAATRGSLHGSVAGGGLPSGPAHHRTASAGSAAGAQRSAHYKSLSADSTARGGSTPGRTSPRSTPAGHAPMTPTEQIMAFRLHEFADGRGIASVVPVATPNDTSEPQLLSMSPEQAEETAARLRELEVELMLRRQESRRGWPCWRWS